jgi:hypothetical protein
MTEWSLSPRPEGMASDDGVADCHSLLLAVSGVFSEIGCLTAFWTSSGLRRSMVLSQPHRGSRGLRQILLPGAELLKHGDASKCVPREDLSARLYQASCREAAPLVHAGVTDRDGRVTVRRCHPPSREAGCEHSAAVTLRLFFLGPRHQSFRL